MKIKLKVLLFFCFCLFNLSGSIYAMQAYNKTQQKMDNLVKAGRVAAQFSEVVNGNVTPELVKERFHGLGEDVIQAALIWSKDKMLRGSVPAFKTYLLFYYVTDSTDMIAAFTNIEKYRLNNDASLEFIFDNQNIIYWLDMQMKSQVVQPKFTSIDGYFVGVYPIIPESKAAKQKCIDCHKNLQRPYDKDTKVFGYTVAATPIEE